MRAVTDQIARWVPGPYSSLGTDGFGFSDTRAAARRFFHVDAESITLAVLTALARRGGLQPGALTGAATRDQLAGSGRRAVTAAQPNRSGHPPTRTPPPLGR